MIKLDSAVLLLEKEIRSRLRHAPFLTVAIDGRCASGKTTLAKALATRLDCPVIPCDDFFLPPEKRTPHRLSEIGGNMERERLLTEVLIPLQEKKPFSYRPFDCKSGSLIAPIAITPGIVTLIEGSYACHAELLPYYDLVILLDVTPEEQKRRILAREGAKAQAFFDKWIPLEERYFVEGFVQKAAHFTFTLEEAGK